MKRKFFISYDIRDDKRLKRVAKFLEEHCLRVQFSLFYIECDIKYLKKIVKGVKELMNKEEDDVRIYRIKNVIERDINFFI